MATCADHAAEAPDFLSVDQAADMLSVSKSTAYRMIRDGIVGAARHGAGRGRLVVPRTEVEYYIKSLREHARAATVR